MPWGSRKQKPACNYTLHNSTDSVCLSVCLYLSFPLSYSLFVSHSFYFAVSFKIFFIFVSFWLYACISLSLSTSIFSHLSMSLSLSFPFFLLDCLNKIECRLGSIIIIIIFLTTLLSSVPYKYSFFAHVYFQLIFTSFPWILYNYFSRA